MKSCLKGKSLILTAKPDSVPDRIFLLPDNIANQIAAGEVIQRPASAVKELLENAVDAGATEINLIIIDAGKTLVQVIDNGSGMSETDARMSFERHATSKIKSIDHPWFFLMFPVCRQSRGYSYNPFLPLPSPVSRSNCCPAVAQYVVSNFLLQGEKGFGYYG